MIYFFGFKVGELFNTGTAGDDVNTLRSFDKNILNAFFIKNHIFKVIFRIQAQKDIYIGKAEVGIKKAYL